MLRAVADHTAERLSAAWAGWRMPRVLERPLAAFRAARAALRAPARAAAPDTTLGEAEAAPAGGGVPQGPGLAAARLDWADKLWGHGFVIPGGEAEIIKLSTLLPVSPATTLLIIGRDAGGATHSIGIQRGAWMNIHVHDVLLSERLAAQVFGLGRRAQVHAWDPRAPAFRPHFHHHALALEPIRCGAAPDALARALAAALKPSGQVVLIETVARPPPPEHAGAFQRWMLLEGWPQPPPTRAAIDQALAQAGFAVHVVEDLAGRHSHAATEGWSRMIAGLKGENRPRSKDAGIALVLEAEAWLLRHRLVAAGVLGTLRWHASLKTVF